jgi:hypothetical protein
VSAFETNFGSGYEYGIEDFFGETVTIRYVATDSTATATLVSNVQVGFEDHTQDAFFVIRNDLATDLALGDELTVAGVTWQVTKANKPGDGTVEIRARAPEEVV